MRPIGCPADQAEIFLADSLHRSSRFLAGMTIDYSLELNLPIEHVVHRRMKYSYIYIYQSYIGQLESCVTCFYFNYQIICKKNSISFSILLEHMIDKLFKLGALIY